MTEPIVDDWRVVFESRDRAACNDRGLVLASIGIPFRIVHDDMGSALVVPANVSGAAAHELRLYDEENPAVVVKPPPKVPTYEAMPGVFGYVIVVCLVAWLDSIAAFGESWRAIGRVDGDLIRGGQWWRLVTALTLHSGVEHLAANLVFGTFFGFLAGRVLGPGVAWFAIVVTAAGGNLLNTLLLESTHKSIGASTAVFAALGLLAGYVWRAKLMSQERWSYRLGPVIGGLALLMYTGGGDGTETDNTDVGAHLMGFISGFVGGLTLTRLSGRLSSNRLQWALAACALLLVALAWAWGFAAGRP